MTPVTNAQIAANAGTQDVYKESAALALLRERRAAGEPLQIACLDIDSTLTGDPSAADRVRSLLDGMGFVVAFDTSRTEEMLLTRHSYRKSESGSGLRRPPPLLGGEPGRHRYVPPEEREPRGVLDGHIIAGSTGTRIALQQRDGSYEIDGAYEARYETSPDTWRQDTLAFLDGATEGEASRSLASIERAEDYDVGRSDVYPPHYRIQLNFDSLESKQRFLEQVRAARGNALAARGVEARVAANLRITDDSKPDTGLYKMFATPRLGSKVRAIEWIVDRLCDHLKVERSDQRLLFAGDSFPDLAMGLWGGLGTDATFLLAGGSRLAGVIAGDQPPEFAGERLGAVVRRLSPQGLPGHYRFRIPLYTSGRRTLIIGDRALPGTSMVETVERYLETLRNEG